MAAADRLPALAAAALLVAAAVALSAEPDGEIAVEPKRVVLEGADSSAHLTLRNGGEKTSTYRLSLVRMRMGERGELSLVDAPRDGELFADGLIRFSPTEVRLEPGLEQTVRFKAMAPLEQAAGEYRAHLLFRPLEEMGSGEEKSGEARRSRVLGVTVPVIVRIGDVRAKVRLATLRVEVTKDGGRIEVTLERVGTASVYGGLTVRHESATGKKRMVGERGGVAVYVPNAKRIVEIPLHLPEMAFNAGGRLCVEYRAADEESTLLAEGSTEFPAPPAQ